MKDTLAAGLTNTQHMTVSPRELVPHVYPSHPIFSKLPDVFSTAFMVGFIEATCAELLHPHLDEGESSVGVHINVSHNAPTPEGMEVTANVRVDAVEGRKVRFAIEVRDALDVISTGTHERFVILAAKFNAKVQAKK